MRIFKPFLLLILMGLSTLSIAAGIPYDKLPKVNGLAITDNDRKLHIAATDQGLYFSNDQGLNWEVYNGYQFPATMATTLPQNGTYAFVVTKGLLQLNNKTNQWLLIKSDFGSQVLRQITASTDNPAKLIGLNQYGKLIVSENYGIDWNKISGPYQVSSASEKNGKNLYAKLCESCHGVDGVGETYTLQALTDKKYILAPALDASAHAWHHTDSDLAKTILDGSSREPRMMAWKNAGVSDKDASDLVNYMKSLWTQRELDCQGPKHMECM